MPTRRAERQTPAYKPSSRAREGHLRSPQRRTLPECQGRGQLRGSWQHPRRRARSSDVPQLPEHLVGRWQHPCRRTHSCPSSTRRGTDIPSRPVAITLTCAPSICHSPAPRSSPNSRCRFAVWPTSSRNCRCLGAYAEILSCLDDCSPFVLPVTAHRGVGTAAVVDGSEKQQLDAAFRRRCSQDNAMCSTSRFAGGESDPDAFESLLADLGVASNTSGPGVWDL